MCGRGDGVQQSPEAAVSRAEEHGGRAASRTSALGLFGSSPGQELLVSMFMMNSATEDTETWTFSHTN